jgi:Ca2+-binding EF-hand superfamily protein
VMTMRSGLTDAEFEKLFSKVDVDQSGRISLCLVPRVIMTVSRCEIE